MIKSYRRGWTVFVNGIYRIYGATEYTPPEMSITRLDIRTGGMDTSVPVDDGMEAMTATFKFVGIDINVLSNFGMQVGSKSTRLTAYEGYQAPGVYVGKIDEMEGIITKITPDAWGNSNIGEGAVTVEMALNYYRSTLDGFELFEIDAENFIRKVNGVNVLADLGSKIRM